MEKSESKANSHGLFHNIDGTKFSPIEEATLVLNTSNATAHSSFENVISKEKKAMNRYGNIDYLFNSRLIRDTVNAMLKMKMRVGRL